MPGRWHAKITEVALSGKLRPTAIRLVCEANVLSDALAYRAEQWKMQHFSHNQDAKGSIEDVKGFILNVVKHIVEILNASTDPSKEFWRQVRSEIRSRVGVRALTDLENHDHVERGLSELRTDFDILALNRPGRDIGSAVRTRTAARANA